ncbi:MAG: transketolase family protein [Myxococcales bacterium]|nr:MAG: transketolase family protein [Myxococcales bacterium]
MTQEQKAKATRQAFGETLASLGASHPDIVVMDADLSKSTKSDIFAKQFPERFFEMGIAEQNMLGVAAGLASTGKHVFCCSFACFLAGRFETIKISVAYAKANVTMVGTHAGVGIGPDGYSQMGLEDLALLRTLPGVQVFQPCDEIETQAIMMHLAKHQGPAYLRLTRQNLSPMHSKDYVFKAGALDVLSEGSDIAIFATGGTVMHALQASELLKNEGISAAVINVPSIKPLNAGEVRAWAKRVSVMLSVEDHMVAGGMGGSLAEALGPEPSAPLIMHGIHDVFGESGSPSELYAKFELDAAGIVKHAKRALKR